MVPAQEPQNEPVRKNIVFHPEEIRGEMNADGDRQYRFKDSDWTFWHNEENDQFTPTHPSLEGRIEFYRQDYDPVTEGQVKKSGGPVLRVRFPASRELYDLKSLVNALVHLEIESSSVSASTKVRFNISHFVVCTSRMRIATKSELAPQIRKIFRDFHRERYVDDFLRALDGMYGTGLIGVDEIVKSLARFCSPAEPEKHFKAFLELIREDLSHGMYKKLCDRTAEAWANLRRDRPDDFGWANLKFGNRN